MDTLDLNCDNCGSVFQLTFSEDEVSNSPDYCPFCADQLTLDDVDDDEESETENSNWD